jgi:acyl carrier protein
MDARGKDDAACQKRCAPSGIRYSFTLTSIKLNCETSLPMTQPSDIESIREILARQGSLSVDAQTLAEDTDLYSVGLTSLATVGIMLALEDKFEIELPESMLSRGTFRSISAMAEAVDKLVKAS